VWCEQEMKGLDQRLEARTGQEMAGSRPFQRPSGQSPSHVMRVSEKV